MLNSVQIEGRLVKDPEPRSMPNGKTTLGFSLAVDRDYKDENGERVCDFVNCVAFGRVAEQIARFCAKGAHMVISGRLEQRRFTARDGSVRNVHEVYAEKAYFLERKNDRGERHEARTDDDFADEVNVEDIPF
jgi:single-strand DNA-binding protein